MDDRARWNDKHAAHTHAASEPSAVLRALDEHLPRRGPALDLAGGRGTEAVWLAARGLTVTLADVSDVALENATQHASDRGVQIETTRLDLTHAPVPRGPWQLVTCANYLHRDLWPTVNLAPGGTVVWVHPTIVNLQRNPRPSARFLLQPGEGVALIRTVPHVQIVLADEQWRDDRHLSIVVGRRPS